MTLSDVTERRALEARLHQAEKLQAIGLLAGGVAHDLNNRLTSVMGYAKMLVQCLEDAMLNRYASNIFRAARGSAELVSQLLAFSRKGNYVNVPTDMHLAIGEVSDLLTRASECRIEIRRQLEARASVISGDPSQLTGALLNLGLNALDAMQGGGTLTFSTDTVTLSELPEGEEQIPLGRYLQIRSFGPCSSRATTRQIRLRRPWVPASWGSSTSRSSKRNSWPEWRRR